MSLLLNQLAKYKGKADPVTTFEPGIPMNKSQTYEPIQSVEEYKSSHSTADSSTGGVL